MVHVEKCPVCGHVDFTVKFACEDYLVSHEKFTLLSCNKCGFVFTQDTPPAATIGRYYEAPDYISHSDTKKGVMNRVYHRVRQRMLQRKVKLVEKNTTTGRQLLEIGCGTGYFSGTMKQRGWKVTAVEPSDTAAEIARTKFGLHVISPASISAVDTQQFDAIALWHVLEHLADVNEQLERFYKLLNDRGVLVIAVPNADSYDARKYQQYWAAYDVPRHIWHFAPASFAGLAKKHHFEITDIKPMPFDAFYIAMLSEKNKGRKCAMLRGLWCGAAAYVVSLFNKKKSSSLIYVLKKKL